MKFSFNQQKCKSIISVVLVATIITSCSVPSNTNSTNTTNSTTSVNSTTSSTTQSPSLLFTQNSSSGSLIKVDGSLNDYVLTLNNINIKTTYFTDRPFRFSGSLKTSEFVKEWISNKDSDSFKNDPPNAAIEFTKEDGSNATLVLELMEPVYDENMKTLTYKSRLIPNSSKIKQSIVNIGETPNSIKFTNANLFIDNLIDKLKTFAKSKIASVLEAKLKPLQVKFQGYASDIKQKIEDGTKAANEKNTSKALEIAGLVVGSLGAILDGIALITGIIGFATSELPPLGEILVVVSIFEGIIGFALDLTASIIGAVALSESLQNSNDPKAKETGAKLSQHIETFKVKQTELQNLLQKVKASK
jgi:hypothetical protein